jgi:hypothetical protein
MAMAATLRWTTAGLEGFPDPLDDTRYEIIGGELYVSRQPGAANETRGRETKLKLYTQRGVDEYWIVDWQRRRVEVYRRAAR